MSALKQSSEPSFTTKKIFELSMYINKSTNITTGEISEEKKQIILIYEKILRMTRSFAVTVCPKGIIKKKIEQYEMKVSQEGVRTVITIKNLENQSFITISGPHKEALLWSIDDINAKFEDINLMYKTIQKLWVQ